MSQLLYEQFHKESKTQMKLVQPSNFTYRLIFGQLTRYIEKNFEILDYGCGVGTIDLFLASMGHKVSGFDISRKAVVAARQSAISLRLDKRSTFSDMNKFNQMTKKKKYDLIICTEVIEHLKEDRETVKKLIGLLKPKGVLFISTPSLNAPLYRLGLTRKFDEVVGHLRRYDPIVLASMIKGLGMKVEKVVKTEGIFRNSLFVIWPFGELIRFIKGPISDLVTFIDDLTVPIFGESDIMVIARKP